MDKKKEKEKKRIRTQFISGVWVGKRVSES